MLFEDEPRLYCPLRENCETVSNQEVECGLVYPDISQMDVFQTDHAVNVWRALVEHLNGHFGFENDEYEAKRKTLITGFQSEIKRYKDNAQERSFLTTLPPSVTDFCDASFRFEPRELLEASVGETTQAYR